MAIFINICIQNYSRLVYYSNSTFKAYRSAASNQDSFIIAFGCG